MKIFLMYWTGGGRKRLREIVGEPKKNQNNHQEEIENEAKKDNEFM